jgi:hypothetical protein
MAQQKKVLIDMSKQGCNYCKEKGHRIHAMDQFGVYLKGEDGERVLACPVLLRKAPKKVEDFPDLSSKPMSKSEIRAKAVANLTKDQAIADKKQRHEAWLAREARREEKALREKEEKVRAEKEYVVNMYTKYGPRWHKQVENTADDSPMASNMRYADEEEEYRRECEQEWEERQAEKEEDERYEMERKGREARRALMTPKEARQDEQDEEDELEDGWLGQCASNEHHYQLHASELRALEAAYKANGWPWPTK